MLPDFPLFVDFILFPDLTDFEDLIDLKLVIDLFMPFFKDSPALEGVLVWKTSEGALLKAGGCC